MRKNLAISVLALAVIMGMAAAASAEPGGLYVTPKLGISIMKLKADADVSFPEEVPLPPMSESYNGGAGSPFFGLAVGYDFKPAADVPVRAELDYAWRGKKEMVNNKIYSGQVDTGWTNRIEAGVQSLFVNGYYDFHTPSEVATPYIGAGLGLARVTADARFEQGDRGEAGELSITKTNFAWNIGAGVALNFVENIALDIGYRYADFGKVTGSLTMDAGDGAGGAIPVSVDASAKVAAHEVILGLRYSF